MSTACSKPYPHEGHNPQFLLELLKLSIQLCGRFGGCSLCSCSTVFCWLIFPIFRFSLTDLNGEDEIFDSVCHLQPLKPHTIESSPLESFIFNNIRTGQVHQINCKLSIDLVVGFFWIIQTQIQTGVQKNKYNLVPSYSCLSADHSTFLVFIILYGVVYRIVFM